MSDNNQIQIELSKKKLIILLIGSVLFVGLGIWFVINPQKFLISFVQNITIIFIAGISGILFFGFVGIFIFKKLFDKKPGLIINDDCVIDNSSAIGAGQFFGEMFQKLEFRKFISNNF